jgi:hypothetical protein
VTDTRHPGEAVLSIYPLTDGRWCVGAEGSPFGLVVKAPTPKSAVRIALAEMGLYLDFPLLPAAIHTILAATVDGTVALA